MLQRAVYVFFTKSKPDNVDFFVSIEKLIWLHIIFKNK